MAFFDELIFWTNWCMAWITTLGIWYCWFMALKIMFLGKLNYGVSQYSIQDELVDFLELIRLVRKDDETNQPYVSRNFFGYPLNNWHYLLMMMISFMLVPFCYYGVSNYGVVIPKEYDITNNPLFNFIFKANIISMLMGTASGFILFTIAVFGMEGRFEQNNLREFAMFVWVFCLTSLIMGTGAIFGMGYLIDVFRYK